MANSAHVSLRLTVRGEKEVSGAMGRLERSLGKVESSIMSLGTAGVVLAAALAAREVINAGLGWERLEGKIRAAVGAGEAARREMDFVRAESKRLGLELQSAGNDFGTLAAAAKGTSLAGQGTRDVFTAVAEASTVLKLSADETSGAIQAVSQMISKGKVSAEELRGQLGERLPGAFQAAARAMNVSTGELDKMLANGEIMAEDFLPKFAKELRKTFEDELPNAVNSAQAKINRFKNVMFELKVRLANSGLMDVFVGSLEWFTNTFVPNTSALFWSLVAGLLKGWERLRLGTAMVWETIKHSVTGSIEFLGEQVGAFMRKLASGLEKVPLDSFKAAADELRRNAASVEQATRRTESYSEAMARLRGEYDLMARSIDELAQQKVDEALNTEIKVEAPLQPGQPAASKTAELSKEAEKLQKQIEKLQESLLSDEDRLFEAAVRRSEMVIQAREQGLINLQTEKDLLFKIEEDYQEKLTKLQLRSLTDRQKFERAGMADKLRMASSHAVQLLQGVAGTSKAMFQAAKIARMSEAALELKAGLSKTWNSYPYPWNIAMTALHGVTGLMHLRDLASASYGNSAAPTTIGYGGGTPTNPVVPTPQPPAFGESKQERTPTYSVHFHGAVFAQDRDELARMLKEDLDKAANDGA